MRRLPKIVLLLSSLCFFISSCKISKYKHRVEEKVTFKQSDIQPVLLTTNAVRFQTTIDVLKNHLSGILIVKQTDSTASRLVFVTELGMKMFEFEMKNDVMNTIYVFEPMNKPAFVKALKANLENMLLLNVYGHTGISFTKENGKNVFFEKKEADKKYYTVSKENKAILQETFHQKKRSSKISYNYSKELNTYSQIKAKQYGLIKFYFELNFILKSND